MQRSLLGLSLLLLAGVGHTAAYQQHFDALPTDWLMYNEATVPAGTGSLRLNPDAGSKRGEAWYKQQQSTQSFTADFQFQIGPHLDADGMTFGWVTATDAAFGEMGSCLGAYTAHYSDRMVHGYDGYFVEIDTFAFMDDGGAPVPHVALCRSTSDVERVQLVYKGVSVTAGQWYDMRVKLTKTATTTARVTVWMDSSADGIINEATTPVLTYDLTNYTMQQGYFGFTGATAAFTEAHYVDNFRLSAGTSVGPKTPDLVQVRPLKANDNTDLHGWALYRNPLDGIGIQFCYQWERSRDGGQTWVKCNSSNKLWHPATKPGDRWRLAARGWNSVDYSAWAYSRQIKILAASSAVSLTASAGPTHAGTAEITVNLSTASSVSATVLNMAGKVVAILGARELPTGLSTLTWNGRTNGGMTAPPGQYVVRLQARTESGAVATCVAPLRL